MDKASECWTRREVNEERWLTRCIGAHATSGFRSSTERIIHAADGGALDADIFDKLFRHHMVAHQGIFTVQSAGGHLPPAPW